MRFSFLFLILFFHCSLMAQGLKGDWMLRGNVSIDHYENGNRESYRVNYFRSQIGYYVKNGLSVGIIEELRFRPGNWSTVGVQPFLRATIFLKRFSPFLQVSGGMEWGKDNFPRNSDYKLYQINIRAGTGIRIGSYATIDMSLNIRAFSRIEPSNTQGNIPRRLIAGLHLTYHFTRDKTAFDSISLTDIYFRKGTKSVGLEGTYLQTGFGSLMLNNRVQLGAIWSSYLGVNSSRNYAWNRIVAEARPFYEIKQNTFFVPTTGISLTSLTIAKTFNFDGLVQIHVHPNVVHFFNRAMLEIGVEARYLFGKSELNPERFSATTILGAQYFLSSKLTLSVELSGNLAGTNWPQKSESYWLSNGDTKFQLGFRYFYQKQPKN